MKPRSWRLWIFGSLALLLLFVCVGLPIWAIHQFGWDWLGFNGGYRQVTIHKGSQDIVLPQTKTLWDWLQLLIVPAILAAGAGFFTWWSARTERQIAQRRYEQDQELALEKQREDLLQSYLDRMADLLIKEHLCSSASGSEARMVARTRTISTLIQLDSKRARTVFVFLKEAQLLGGSDPVLSFQNADLSTVKWSKIKLSGFNLARADLSGADLARADLSGADLTGARLWGAYLTWAHLARAHLARADLSGAYLARADLAGADFTWANLTGANLTGANLSGADLTWASLWGADLTWAHLSGAHLSEANLRGAHLSGANLSGANLSGADLSGADLSEVNLSGADLTRAKGLTPEHRNYHKARGALVDAEATPAVPSSPGTTPPSAQEAKPAALSSANQAPPATPTQEAASEAASLQKQAAVKQAEATPMPPSSAQEGTPSVLQGSATTSSSLQASNVEKQPGS